MLLSGAWCLPCIHARDCIIRSICALGAAGTLAAACTNRGRGGRIADTQASGGCWRAPAHERRAACMRLCAHNCLAPPGALALFVVASGLVAAFRGVPTRSGHSFPRRDVLACSPTHVFSCMTVRATDTLSFAITRTTVMQWYLCLRACLSAKKTSDTSASHFFSPTAPVTPV